MKTYSARPRNRLSNLLWKPERKPSGGRGEFQFQRIATLTLCLGVSITAGASFMAESPGTASAGLQRHYASVTSITGDFRQTYRAPGVNQVESGVFWMKRPGLMRWEYRDPEIKLFIADGRDTFLYTPEDRQVLISRFSAAELHNTPLQLLLGRADLNKSFDVAWENIMKPVIPGTRMLKLVPRPEEAEYAGIVLEYDEETYDLRRIVINEKSGNTSEFFLTNIRTNVKTESAQFRFQIPKGVEIVRVDER
jgi:outer membrane lipoprotein carrier protein